jgi:prepilin-type N-terminal cleavage/methylation domain-containing protein
VTEGPGSPVRLRLKRLAPRHLSPVTRHSLAAFTLVEMLIVVAIIGILAAMTMPIVGAVKKTQIRTRARGEMAKVELAIEAYKAKQGYYPPDNAPNYMINQLYYELLGTTNINGTYHTLDDSAQITTASLPIVFGPNVTGFMNCTRGGGGDEGASARPFINSLRPSQFLTITNSGLLCTVLGAGLDGSQLLQSPAPGLRTAINPWRYNSSSPRYNPKSFDLWIDVLVGGKTNRICNWSEQPLVVSTPY